MKLIRPALSAILLLLCLHSLSSQTTADYFSLPGLSLNAFHYNIYDGLYSTSYTFHRKDTFCGNEVLVYYNNQEGYPIYLRMDGGKVFYIYSDYCYEILLYDFGLTEGESITEGLYEGWEVGQVYEVFLENGETRRRFDLTNPDAFDVSWIEGIGDINYGLIPQFGDFEGYDVFICAGTQEENFLTNPLVADSCAKYSCVTPIIEIDYQTENYSVTFENQSLYADSFSWEFGDGQFSNEVSPVHLYENPGCYSANVKVKNACYPDEIVYQLNIPVCIGDPWVENYTVDTFFFLQVNRYSDSLEFAYAYNDLYRITDDGQQWTKINLPPTPIDVDRRISDIEMFDAQRGIMVCGHIGGNGDKQGILVTSDGGLTWEENTPGSNYMLRQELAPDGRAWAIGQYRYYRTFDYGHTWEKIEYPGGFYIYNIQFIHDSLLIGRSFTGNQPSGTYHLIKSVDNGLTWNKIGLPYEVRQWHFFDADHGYGFREGSPLSVTSDGGASWTPIDLPFEVSSYSFYSMAAGWIVDDTGLVHYTRDSLQTFEISNCGRTILNRITPITDTTAYAIAGVPLGSSASGKTKVTFDQAHAVGCLVDADQDGYPEGEDCDDHNPEVNAGQQEIPYNGLDDDCDTLTLDDDLDQDGYPQGEDCDDTNPDVNADQDELPYNGLDDDCDALTFDDDLDQDGFGINEDCNDSIPLIYPGATEIPGNGVDEDCNGSDLITTVEPSEKSWIRIYPNPASDILSIQTNQTGGFSWNLINPQGKLLAHSENETQINISSLHDGLYFLEVHLKDSGRIMLEKVVISH
ncbi:MAG TPA: MopE-related protein [Saprospiraceae bacterium]